MFELKRLSTAAIPAALAKAERYRLLNEPEEAQSICEDVLHADPDNFEAVRTLILALTDSFPNHDPNNVSRAQELVARLPTEYERAYFSGLVAERRARALLTRGGPGRAVPAGDLLRMNSSTTNISCRAPPASRRIYQLYRPYKKTRVGT